MAEIKLDEAPPETRAFYSKGIAVMERGNLDYAMDMFEEALKIEPRLLEARKLNRAAALRQNKNRPAGKIAMAKATGTMLKAITLLKRNPLASLALSERLLRIDPINLKFAQMQCDAAEASGMPEVAIMTLEILRDKRPPSLSVLEALARLYQKTERFQEEFDCRTKIVEMNPTDGPAQKELKDAAARLTMGKAGWQTAESFRELVKNEPDGSVQQAKLEEIKAQVSANPGDTGLRMQLADLLLMEKRYEEAIATLENHPTSSGPSEVRVEQKLQTVRELHLSQQLAEAEDANNLGRIAEIRKALGELRAENARLQVDRYPNDLQLKFEYGKLLFAEGKYTEAIQQFQLAQRNPQRRVRALIYMAQAFRKKNQPEIALEQLKAVLPDLPGMDETKKEVLYEMALLFEQTGRPDDATKHLREIYAVDIGYRDVANRIENQSTQRNEG